MGLLSRALQHMAAPECGETDLSRLVSSLSPELSPDVLAFLHLTNADRPPDEIQQKAVFTFREREGNTFVVRQDLVEKYGYQYEFPCRMITLAIHSSLQAVGFLAVILSELADNDVPCNVASGFFHDHLFVPEGSELRVMQILEDLASGKEDSDSDGGDSVGDGGREEES